MKGRDWWQFPAILVAISLIFVLVFVARPTLWSEWWLLVVPLFFTVGAVFYALEKLRPDAKDRIDAVGLGVLLASVVAFFVIGGMLIKATFAPFDNHMHDYLSASVARTRGGHAYVSGKVLPVDKTEKIVDRSVYFALPGGLKARLAQDVGTVVWLDWGTTQVGTYTGGGNAYVRTCEATVIDESRNAIVGTADFTGTDPPSGKTSSGDAYGDAPVQKVVNYIVALPRK